MKLYLTQFHKITEKKLNKILERSYKISVDNGDDFVDEVIFSPDCIKYMEKTWKFSIPIKLDTVKCKCCGHEEGVTQWVKKPFKYDPNKVHVYDSDYGAVTIKMSGLGAIL